MRPPRVVTRGVGGFANPRATTCGARAVGASIVIRDATTGTRRATPNTVVAPASSSGTRSLIVNSSSMIAPICRRGSGTSRLRRSENTLGDSLTTGASWSRVGSRSAIVPSAPMTRARTVGLSW